MDFLGKRSGAVLNVFLQKAGSFCAVLFLQGIGDGAVLAINRTLVLWIIGGQLTPEANDVL